MSSQAEQKTSTLSALGLTARSGKNPQITGLTVDSREVQPGSLFFALPGARVHGGEFIQYALRMGAAAVVTDAQGAEIAAKELAESAAALIVTDDPRGALAQTASLWFGAHPETVIAVTGTNGKTSISTFARQIWIEMGLAAVNLGTTGIEGAWTHPLRHTTPEPITLHRALAEARAEGITHVAMEASSHGLDQRRLDGVMLAAAGFSNFTQDHLDYHKTFEAYFDAKMGLFTRLLPEDGVAVVNIDDPKGPEVVELAEGRGVEVITVGRAADARLRLTGQRFDGTGQEILFDWQRGSHKARLNLIGGFQADNVLLAAGLVIAAGGDAEEAFDTLPYLTTVRGRMQHAATRANGGAVFVDYAHTPDAIATALQAMRPHVMGKLVAIVGAGGDRDAGKRPLMGQAAAEHADVVFVTDDNPRTEDPAAIRAAVMEGAKAHGAGKSIVEVGDRAEAILRGVDALGPGDALLIAGKGHESGQTIGDDVLPFDDVEQASVAVSALDGAF
ncbi:UDP-N-acetylmuramoyl-L-alanyl-D-glutamate--2,6-diaminopimelate ligase [Thalassorhabdomicrobium marinisediminis]|uniref:UDP-N-acetylmuramoyl-L-alanyl-D-glutamate--2, 6-diaminopimelate ligase n=1 Tax=Thalassorhabdomicrobium marinisediminis TaxID=2170577 RepID=UPI002493530F|nr:UDP-N-acetylmuramoyl-L-alanyl-D-glutamate--2,6-diaminopimelate ligase [Thalassorhabdomicrobium marinisediminis]